MGEKKFDIFKVGCKIDLSQKDVFMRDVTVHFSCSWYHIINDLILFLNIRLEHFNTFS